MNWKIRNLLLALFLFQTLLVFGQKNPERKEKREQIEIARIGYITSAINLTESQATKFWPVYNEYSKERKRLKRQGRNLLKDKNLANISETEAKKLLEDLKSLRIQEASLSEIYEPKLLEVVSYRQLVQLMKAEREFIRMLHKKASGQGEEFHHSEEDVKMD
jgi:Spy/CpxP family protein refolding chaperone